MSHPTLNKGLSGKLRRYNVSTIYFHSVSPSTSTIHEIQSVKRCPQAKNQSKPKTSNVSSKASGSIQSFKSLNAEHIIYDAMKDTAALIINHLYIYTKKKKYNSNLVQSEVDDIDEIWNDLQNKQLEVFSKTDNILKSFDIKNELTKRYLKNMQMLLYSRLGIMEYFLRRISHLDPFKPEWKDKGENLEEYHRYFFETRLRKLIRERHGSNIRRLHSLIVMDEVPNENHDLKILREYERDPHHYTILILLLNKDSCIDPSAFGVIERNFECVMTQIDRKRRRERISQMIEMQQDVIWNTESICKEKKPLAVHYEGPIILTDLYLIEKRAKWAQYFADQKKTPTMLHLEDMRKQKLQARAAQRLAHHKQKPKSRHYRRSITELYTAPRLTHRLRQAVEQIAEESLVSTTKTMKRRMMKKRKEEAQKALLSNEECGPNIADLLLDCESWTSCCSKCENALEPNATGPALKQFFRIHEQILNYDNQTCCTCSSN